jgi:hypothetical protein
MAGLVPAIHVFGMAGMKTWMPGTRPGMTIFLIGQLRVGFSGRVSRNVPAAALLQTIAAQAILAIERHRQARGFFSTPA